MTHDTKIHNYTYSSAFILSPGPPQRNSFVCSGVLVARVVRRVPGTEGSATLLFSIVEKFQKKQLLAWLLAKMDDHTTPTL